MYREQYPYLYETHLHTSMGSACARNTPEEMVRAAKKWGYTGIFITEHNWRGNSAIDRSLPWETWIDGMASSYYAAKAEGDRIGLAVFFAYEAGFWGLSCHGAEFLVYGLTPDWLKQHPQLKDMNAPEHLALVREAGAMVVHAHPYREASYIEGTFLFPESVDAVETVNSAHSNSHSKSHNRQHFDVQAREYATAHNLPMTAGSDIHWEDLYGGGVAFKQPLRSVEDYCRAIRSEQDYLLTNGEQVFDRRGNLLEGAADWA